jgi:hypothetical protein
MSFDNKGIGFDQKNNKGSMILYNCSAYRNKGNNFSVSAPLAAGKILEVKNCVSADNKISLGSFAIQATNSWMPPFTVSLADFASLDTTGVSGPRKPDGSLPDVPFLHLAKGSDLIDNGTDIGLPFKGILPDLGAFESDFSTGVVIKPGIENEFRAGFFHDDLIIRFNNQLNESFQCSLVRLNGQIAFTFKIEAFGQSQKINCNQLSQGFYILKFSSGYKQWESQKLVKMN